MFHNFNIDKKIGDQIISLGIDYNWSRGGLEVIQNRTSSLMRMRKDMYSDEEKTKPINYWEEINRGLIKKSKIKDW